MIAQNQGPKVHSNAFSVFAGLLVGSLAGAVTMLLFAPQSGEETRMQMREKGIELRDRTLEIVEVTVSQVRSKTNQLANTGRTKIKELKHQGQGLAVEQLERVSEAALAGKDAIQGSINNNNI
jgi:gas vesicle protein